MRVAFVGAGQIGAPMSERLLAAGHELTVYARRAEVREHFARLGAAVTDSLAEAAEGADAVHLALYSDEQLAEVTLALPVRVRGASSPTSGPTPCSSPTPPVPRPRSGASPTRGTGTWSTRRSAAAPTTCSPVISP